MQNLNNLLKLLLENDIEFVIVGGFAAIVHGSSFVTKDLDVCAPMTPDQLQKLRKCLADIHPKHRQTPQKLSFLEVPEQWSGTKNLYIQTDLGVLDMLEQVTGIGDFSVVVANAMEIDVFGRKCKVMGVNDLIRAKLVMGSPKDLAVVKELRLISGHDESED
jgi:predicted nucleotidyltransferase